ncbi:50S ribosomal protein L1, partial [Dissostichus eleginoides]
DCFEHTQWEVFEHIDLATYTESVLAYIKFCIENVTVVKRIRVFPNQKPWMTGRVHMLRARDSAFRSGDRALYSAARVDLRRGIIKAKADYKTKIEEQLASNNPRQVWQGIQSITIYRGCDLTAGDSS